MSRDAITIENDDGLLAIAGHRPLLFDHGIVLIVGMLMTIGVVMVYSAAVSLDQPVFDLSNWHRTPLRQGAFAALGLLTMVIVAQLDYRTLSNDTLTGRRLAWLVWLMSAVLLVVVLIPGVGSTQLGATRWLRVSLGPIDASFQPGEFAKVGMIIWLAAVLTRGGLELGTWAGGFRSISIASAALIGLTAIEDYGTGALMGVVFLTLLWQARARWWQVLLIITVGAVLGAGFIYYKWYRVQRLLTWFDKDADASGAAYQVNQALMAIGSGGWWGVGLGAGVQKHGYLPQAHNDFILAIICEELGAVGGMFVALLFLMLLIRGWWIAANAPDALGRLLASGLTTLICLQAAFNIAVVTNSVPTKGISLPFVSAGGSGVLFLGVAAGLLASVGGAALRDSHERWLERRAAARD